ncbi:MULTISPECIES: glucans biosynthesis protein MdoC [Pantoea]|jgi:glucan biosynthesis protein C|uniref:Glucans biosynthesis protein C n=1 Tax=Pantoea dispersa TaxID=59814 RepID=A0A8E1V8L7_9GAMM|nr:MULTISPECIES: glucans biosynthesis protein MdoC [Pantoea]ERH67269.1 glucan biosynthesis protein [Pantoea dispersa EGD-AAK13]KAA6103818.1 glucans biosynthesis protein MdoC [Pantoea sp. B_9]KAA6116029.1 glucans biosynthesis protein MdoC [Pantoea sp. B_10]KAA8670760.1 glucans biosynthesis protein MdoC [Pantoea dispersa]KTR92178.1 glucans biosynthesis protein [Pantoea dispersa]
MSSAKPEREYFLDSIRAYLMLLGVPFHVSLIYSTQRWSVNSQDASLWLTVLNDFIHAFRMQVFFVISGYFSYMLYLRYQPNRWLKVRLERVGIPLLTAVPLITLPQFFMLKNLTSKVGDWANFSLYDKYNALMWDLISHLWFLLVLVILTAFGMLSFRWLRDQQRRIDYQQVGWGKLTLALLAYALVWCAFRRLIFHFAPALLMDGLFSIAVMQSLFFLPFFMLGALSWKHQALKALFVRFNPVMCFGAIAVFIAYSLNQRYSSGEGWLYELDAIISTLMGLCMLNVCFSFGHKLLNSHSPRIMYLVNASLFIYLVHHPLTILYGIYVTPHISSNTLGFFVGLLMVFGVAFALYEIHLRIPLLRFLFSGKPQRKPETSAQT